MRRTAATLILALSIALASSTVSAAVEDPSGPATAGPSVRVVVDSASLSEYERDQLGPWIHEDGTKTLARAGARVVPDDEGAEMEVRIVVRYEDMNYYFHVSAWEPGATAAKVARDELVCKVCNQGELLAMINGELMWLGGWLVHPPATEPADDGADRGDDGGETDTGQTGDGADDGAQRDTQRPDGKALRNAGLGLLVPGGVALGVGIGLAIVDTRSIQSDAEQDRAERHYRPTGIALAVTGGAAAVAGAVLLVLHSRRAKRADAVSLSPMVGPSTTGLAIGGRF